MGSKSRLLSDGLGEILLSACQGHERFVDLFSGSGTVSHFVAENTVMPVLSNDLQRFGGVLAGAIVLRDRVVRVETLLSNIRKLRRIRSSEDIPSLTADDIFAVRKLCADDLSAGFFVRHYGGHYYSHHQAALLDEMYACLPSRGSVRTVGLAVLIHTASKCAAAPGHTAQPFQPTIRLLPFIKEAWSQDPYFVFESNFRDLCSRYAATQGWVTREDAVSLSGSLRSGDLVFVDPPYSEAQYSRFYHLFEAICVGGYETVTGSGRMPSRDARPQSAFSRISSVQAAFEGLLAILAARGVTVLVTYPAARCSNGFSGSDVKRVAEAHFSVTENCIDAVHSTLGGPGHARGPRRAVVEMVLTLRPRARAGQGSLSLRGVVGARIFIAKIRFTS